MDLSNIIEKAVTEALSVEVQRFNNNIREITEVFRDSNYELELLSVKEVSKILGTNVETVRVLIRKGLLKGIVLGSMKVAKQEIINFLKDYAGKDLSDLEDIKTIEEVG